MTHEIIIGLAGYAQSGKDSVGKILNEGYGFHTTSFASYLREVTAAFNPVVGLRGDPVALLLDDEENNIRWLEALETLGYERAKATYPEFRRALQYMGTEVVRKRISNSFWVDYVFKKIRDTDFGDGVNAWAITDVRFENEADAVKKAGGYNVWISRPGVGPLSDHVSEHGLDDWKFDHVLFNSGSLDDLYGHVRIMLSAVDR